MEDNKPVIITSTNEQYVLPLCIMLRSLENTLDKNLKITIYVLQHQLPASVKTFIRKVVNSSSISIVFIEVENDILGTLKIDGHISIETYYRLLIEDLFPFLNKVIYLDADLLIKKSISELWSYEFKDAFLLAVPHASKESGYAGGPRGLPAHHLIGIAAETRLFNAGVMVINLEKWRRFEISKKILIYLKKYQDHVLWWDQDGLNAILHDKWNPLPPTWNVMTSHLSLFSSHSDSLLSEDDFEIVHNFPDIIHFSGPVKPWMPHYDGPFAGVFNELGLTISSKMQADGLVKKAGFVAL